ncbi:hypothetical protein Pyn_36483 [Prunus yedoensis var. nudiflora]|uniref:Pentatricopeptide repeat-containing protein n=1 Tax=Prunus yedoensis var. nudiflora TaxID=2094558 RepID=A0A314YX02_PRUYE|nr:hypothetical protein Pyn_36483 [Prunus yedoensis var. nudiflora]
MWTKSLRFSSKFLTSKNSLYLSSISSSAANDVVRHSLSQSHPTESEPFRRLLLLVSILGPPKLLCTGLAAAMVAAIGSSPKLEFCLTNFFTFNSSAYAFATGHEHDEVEAQHEANNLITGRNSTSEPSGTYRGYYGQNNLQLQQKLNGACADGSRDPQQSSKQYNPSYSGVFKRSTSNEFLNHPVQQDGNFSGHNGQENEGLLQTPELDWRHLENGSIQNPYASRQEGSIEVRQNPDGFSSQGNSGFQGNLNQNFYAGMREAKALEKAKFVHENITRLASPLEVCTYNRILEMYSKCGSMDNAFMVFNKMPKPNLTSWNIMITWLAKNGLGEDAIDLFNEFKKAGLKPDGQMFIGVFHACSVLEDTTEGLLHFESMSKDMALSRLWIIMSV